MGVTFDDTEKKFVFDFEHDGAEDVVSLTGEGYQVEAFIISSAMVMNSLSRWKVLYVLLLLNM